LTKLRGKKTVNSSKNKTWNWPGQKKRKNAPRKEISEKPRGGGV